MTDIEEGRQALVAWLSERRRHRPAPPAEPRGGWMRRAACTGRPAMFDNPECTNDALRLCARCPVLAECRVWALRNAVHGVAGGMTATARAAWRENQHMPEPVAVIADFLPLTVAGADQGGGLGRSDVILRAVAERTAQGPSGCEIADELGVTRRTVERLRVSSPARATA